MFPWLVLQVFGQSVYGPDYIPPNPKHSLPYWLDPPRFAKIASCVVDGGLAVVSLGHAGAALDAALENCRTSSTGTTTRPLRREGVHNEHRHNNTEFFSACPPAIVGVASGISYAVGFLAQAGADCESSLRLVDPDAVKQAECAADVSSLVGALALVGKSALIVGDTCPLHSKMPSSLDRLAENTRRLAGLPETENQEERTDDQLKKLLRDDIAGGEIDSKYEADPFTMQERSTELAMCAFDVGQAVFFLAQAGLMINQAVGDCSRFELRTGGHQAKLKCETDVKKLISAFAFVSSGLSYATFHCPFYKQVPPACAGALSNLVAALADISAVSTSFQATCGHVERRDISKLKQPPERHLAEERHIHV
jgi:hypothetical protein